MTSVLEPSDMIKNSVLTGLQSGKCSIVIKIGDRREWVVSDYGLRTHTFGREQQLASLRLCCSCTQCGFRLLILMNELCIDKVNREMRFYYLQALSLHEGR